MKFVVDESVDGLITRILVQSKIEIIDISNQHPGISDKEILTIANDQKAIILTEDKDFGELVYRFGLNNRGIILIRMLTRDSAIKAQKVLGALKKHASELENSFCVISEDKLRIRKYLE